MIDSLEEKTAKILGFSRNNGHWVDKESYVVDDEVRQINNLLIEARIDEWEKLFLPTHPAIAKKRGWKEDEWRGYLGLPIAGRDNQYL